MGELSGAEAPKRASIYELEVQSRTVAHQRQDVRDLPVAATNATTALFELRQGLRPRPVASHVRPPVWDANGAGKRIGGETRPYGDAFQRRKRGTPSAPS